MKALVFLLSASAVAVGGWLLWTQGTRAPTSAKSVQRSQAPVGVKLPPMHESIHALVDEVLSDPALTERHVTVKEVNGEFQYRLEPPVSGVNRVLRAFDEHFRLAEGDGAWQQRLNQAKGDQQVTIYMFGNKTQKFDPNSAELSKAYTSAWERATSRLRTEHKLTVPNDRSPDELTKLAREVAINGPTVTKLGNVTISGKPVLLSKAMCSSCHTSTPSGETIAVAIVCTYPTPPPKQKKPRLN